LLTRGGRRPVGQNLPSITDATAIARQERVNRPLTSQ
jgi:hypothetical protein